MAQAELVKAMEVVLANSYILYLKTQNYHWNVVGPNFKALHGLFEEQYQDLAVALDLLAERIRALGVKVNASFPAFEALQVIEHGEKDINSVSMLEQLAADQHKIIAKLHNALKIAERLADEVTADILIGRLTVHEKNAWMLASSI